MSEKAVERNPRAMVFEINRLRTYTKWIYKDDSKVKCTPERMAKAGFNVLVDEPGTAKCFVCMKTLDGWEREDDPFEEHKKHAPQCPYVKLNKEEDDLTLSDLVQLLMLTMDLNLAEQQLQTNLKKVDEMRAKGLKKLRESERKAK